jgi:malic enzyme
VGSGISTNFITEIELYLPVLRSNTCRSTYAFLTMVILVLICFVNNLFGNDFLEEPEVSAKNEMVKYTSDLNYICCFFDQIHGGKDKANTNLLA